MRSPRVQKTVTSPLFVKPQLTTASTPKTTPRKVKKHPQPVTLNLGRMMKFDARNRKSSATVSQILEKKSEYSTPAGVKQFLYNHTVEKTQYHSAVIIQRTWKRYKALQRLFRFLNFAHRMVQKQHRFIFYTWYIRMTPPANIATRVYNHLVSFLKTENFSIDNRLKLASFDEFMKTNHLCLRKDLDVSKIYKFIRIMNKSTMRKIFLCWSDYAVDQVTIKKGSVKANLLWKSRVRFGFEYVAFHFWRNWSFFKKHNRFNPTIEAHMYIPEWTFFRSTIETKIRMKKQADYQRKITLLSNSFHSIRENSLYETKLAQRYQNCIKIFMRSTMNKAVRALANNVIFTKLNQGIKKRVIKAWYHTIDVEIIKKTAAGAYKKRVELKILNKVFHGWNNFSTREMIRIVKLITSARENEVKFLKIIYPLVNDFPHFFAIQAYAKWKHLIHMEKRANKFVYWTFNLARTREFYKFILDVFRENIGHPMNYYDFWHYRFDGDKNFYAHHKKTSGKNSRSAHFWKQIHKLLAKKEEISLVYPPPSISTTINAIKHVENFPSYGEWATTATSDQVRTLFYRIILAVTNKNLLYIRKPQEKITKRLDKSLDDFQKENKLMTYSQICEFRDQLEIQSVERRLLRKFRNRRDHDQLVDIISGIIRYCVAQLPETK
ncbi:hypothetical protein TRFO_35181 [Tritrichomonas foetus]|uniref:IQ calmodulin-binding motif family protein n=1 Tax=Tritrichomonas foetus TaxID=1144522 RepID=A0A1J4JGW4_9EUKA|nr:hypothetical protein TRFO_35181 [Tritrichomonas foetus]|eukprot:OHS98408.1 hypothetical protein TRFO_35181 [Tritrichomonas foetus]